MILNLSRLPAREVDLLGGNAKINPTELTEYFGSLRAFPRSM